MYTDEDLYSAVKEGIFEESAINDFREFIARSADTKMVDEENFRLISGFNDIFVSVSAFILLVSIGWIGSLLGKEVGFLLVAATSWLLSVFFILKKKLALPAILLLLGFVFGVIFFLISMVSNLDMHGALSALIVCSGGALAAWGHWVKFKVPITVAVGVASLVACVLVPLAELDSVKENINIFLCLSGILSFMLAMHWDSKDTARKTRKSDVAFWLHLLSAPLIVHPIFSALGILKGDSSLIGVGLVVVVYVFLAVISITVDRRALMVSSIVYVLYAFKEVFSAYGMVASSLAVSGFMISTLLLLLSAFWHKSRVILLNGVPDKYLKYVPPIN